MTAVLDVLGDNETATGDVRRLLQERINLADVRAALAVVADCTEWTGDENTASEMIRRFATIRAFLPSLAGSGCSVPPTAGPRAARRPCRAITLPGGAWAAEVWPGRMATGR